MQTDDDKLVEHIASILEEWDMKDPPDAFTGHAYTDIAADIAAAVRRIEAFKQHAPEALLQECAEGPSVAAIIETYKQMHETAKELGYPSILEALEATPTMRAALKRERP